MDILFLVTTETCKRDPFEHVAAMASLALCFGVGAGEGKARIGVVKLCFLPGSLLVARLAGSAETLAVHVLEGMAVIACHADALVDFAEVA